MLFFLHSAHLFIIYKQRICVDSENPPLADFILEDENDFDLGKGKRFWIFKI